MAQLMWRRELLTQLTKVPAKVKKKLAELHRKFEEDSTQASIHLEPVQGARDPKVRSARVGDDYRAIIIAPEQGDTYLLVYVDHHDEAYQWCQSKQFEAHGALGTLQIFDVEEVARAVAVPEEFSAAASAAIDNEGLAAAYPLDVLDDEALFTAGIPKALIPAVRAVRTDEAFEQLAEYLPPEAAQVLYGVVAGMSLDQALEEMLGALETAPVKPAGPGDFSHLAQAANLDLVLVASEEDLKEILSEDIEAWRIFLHPYQRKLVQWDVKGPMKIRGAAGTGKTVALMHRAVWLARQTADQDRVLLTTYTTNLSVTIKALLERLAPKEHQGIEVTNLHQLARTIALRCGWRGKVAEDADLDPLWERNLLTFEGVVHQARLAVEQGQFPRYRHVLVDELQDFGLEALRLIRALSPIDEGLANPLCVVGDGHQRLYNRTPVPLGRAGIEVRGRSRRLKTEFQTARRQTDRAASRTLRAAERTVRHIAHQMQPRGGKPARVKAPLDHGLAEVAERELHALVLILPELQPPDLEHV